MSVIYTTVEEKDLIDYSETVPVQYERSSASFFGHQLYVDPRVFIPRPETELLAERTIHFLRELDVAVPDILEVGTGSGNIPVAIASEIEECRITALDISSEALDVARLNIERHDLVHKIELLRSDMFEKTGEQKFDCIVSNPPYVAESDHPHLDAWVRAEPETALVSGPDGLDHFRELAAASRTRLKKGGFAAVEIGYDQAPEACRIFERAGLRKISLFRDVNGYERVIAGWNR